MRQSSKLLLQGFTWIIIGTAISILGYSNAEPGEHYYIFWGLPLYGIFKIIQAIEYDKPIISQMQENKEPHTPNRAEPISLKKSYKWIMYFLVFVLIMVGISFFTDKS